MAKIQRIVSHATPMEDRYNLYSERLSCPEGLTKEYAFGNLDIDENNFKQDIKRIGSLLEQNGIILKRTTKLPVVYSIDCEVDLWALKTQMEQKMTPALFDFLAHIPNGLPDEFVESLGLVYKDFQQSKIHASFEINSAFSYFEYFPIIYKSINKQCLKITYRQFNSDNETTYIFCPEYLKQYNTLWYAFGMASEEPNEEMQLMKFDILLITSAEYVDCKFVHSDIEDYSDYFADIVGVENYEKREVEDVRLLVKGNIVNRLRNNPIHESFKIDKDSVSPIDGYVCASINVKLNKELERSIISYGNDILVLSPDKLKKEIAKQVKKLNDFYIS